MKKKLIVLTTLLAALTIFFGLTYLSRLKMEYTTEGNYFYEREGVVYHQQGVLIWGTITFMLFLFTILAAYRLKKNSFKAE